MTPQDLKILRSWSTEDQAEFGAASLLGILLDEYDQLRRIQAAATALVSLFTPLAVVASDHGFTHEQTEAFFDLGRALEQK